MITGGASGIGLATAEVLLERGARVLIADIAEEAGREEAARLGCGFVRADVGRREDWRTVALEVDAQLGGLELLHLNAGVATGAEDILEMTDEQFERAMHINVYGVMHGLRVLVPHIADAGGGAVVLTSSLAGLMDFTPDPVYTLTKHALTGLVRALVPQFARRHITVNAICPNVTATPAVGPVEFWEQRGFVVIPVQVVAEAVVAAMTGSASGQSIVCQPGRDPIPYDFRNVPGPRSEGGEKAGSPSWPGHGG